MCQIAAEWPLTACGRVKYEKLRAYPRKFLVVPVVRGEKAIARHKEMNYVSLLRCVPGRTSIVTLSDQITI
jgi:hypothetical protein